MAEMEESGGDLRVVARLSESRISDFHGRAQGQGGVFIHQLCWRWRCARDKSGYDRRPG
jgi:hypothetical protein